ncbi:hypothetical protein [Clostridium estertheticum]|uniref:hypothetical protein n=1 Tax=Clostridium estertheticum TaxID=238834 RepID=UPI002714BCCF|nr:hypothetical protein [Clostridium estertheticum]WLC80083.1 hypothetical protein KTC98_01620 [Clostridium estertheticum]
MFFIKCNRLDFFKISMNIYYCRQIYIDRLKCSKEISFMTLAFAIVFSYTVVINHFAGEI